jgi:glycosyltransferase involved in cell wall biosynthesis
MRILYLHQYFATNKSHVGTRSYEFARRWAKAGNEVVMFTSSANLTKEELLNSEGYIFKKFFLDGIKICSVNIPYRQNMAFIFKIFSFLSFCIFSVFYILTCKKPNIVYASSTPLTIGIPALVGKWIRSIPFLFEVRDQWPEIPIEMGIISNRLVIKVLLFLEKIIYKNSSKIIALSIGMKKGIEKVIQNKNKIHVIPNCADIDFFHPNIDGTNLRKKYGWEQKIVFLHPGTIGKVNNIDFIIEAAEKLKGNPKIIFVLLGEGSEKKRLMEITMKRSLTNVQFLPSVPKKQIPKYLSACDVGLVIIGQFSILQDNSANKFFDILSSGKPVLLNYSGWQKEILESWGAGMGVKLCDLGEFTKIVNIMACDPLLRQQMGYRARKLSFIEYDRDKCSNQILSIVKTQLKV